jgi:hypothetical protein
MQHCAVLSRYEGIRKGLGRIALYDRAAASRMVSAIEHWSRTDRLRDGASSATARRGG